ncbi:FemAB family PEP-CTERM system-associated protein [soil metagenome]
MPELVAPVSEPVLQPSVPTIDTLQGAALTARLPELARFVVEVSPRLPLSRHPGWLAVLRKGLGHTPYCLEARLDNQCKGVLPLAAVKSRLFGHFLVGLPYLNYGGPLCSDRACDGLLLQAAKDLADRLNVRYLELRDERAYDQSGFVANPGLKLHMRLPLPHEADLLWKKLDTKVRNQVRKGQKSGLELAWGGQELVDEFHAVFSENMRDLGTPAYDKRFFRAILEQFPDRAELGIARLGVKPVACCLLLHGWGITEVPSASSLRAYNSTCANMLLYWTMLERAVARGQAEFDFGRSSPDSPTYRFKKQWGALPHQAVWNHYVRKGNAGDMRPTNPKYGRAVQIWQKLPLWLTRIAGPLIVRGIP